MYPGFSSSSVPDRAAHIHSLREYFPSTRELQRDYCYEVPCQLPQRVTVNLRCNLSPSFPQTPPSFSVFPAVNHQFVDAQTQAIRMEASRDLMYWKPQHLLGKIVFDIVQSFLREPPSLRLTSSASHQSASSPAVSSNPMTSSISMPAIPSSFPQLSKMTASELGELLNDEQAFQRFFFTIDGVKTMKQLRDDLKRGASSSHSSDEIDQLDQDLKRTEAKIAEQRALLAKLSAEQEQFMRLVSVDNLILKLAELARQVEEKTDEMSADFTNGDLSVAEFKKSYLPERSLFHTRAAKKESLSLKKDKR